MINLINRSIKHSVTVLREWELMKVRYIFFHEIFNKNVAMRLSLFLLGNLQNEMIAITISRCFTHV